VPLFRKQSLPPFPLQRPTTKIHKASHSQICVQTFLFRDWNLNQRQNFEHVNSNTPPPPPTKTAHTKLHFPTAQCISHDYSITGSNKIHAMGSPSQKWILRPCIVHHRPIMPKISHLESLDVQNHNCTWHFAQEWKLVFVKSTNVRLVGYIVQTEWENVQGFSLKPEGRDHYADIHRPKDNIKIDLKHVQHVDWIHLPQEMIQWWILVNEPSDCIKGGKQICVTA
jgi:hypothetical protein